MPYYVVAVAEDEITAAIIMRLLLEHNGKYELKDGVRNLNGVGNLNRKVECWETRRLIQKTTEAAIRSTSCCGI